MDKKDRYHQAIDGMRVLAILAVLSIHSSTRVLEASVFDIQGNMPAFFLNQASRFAVPLFFMISGFVLEVNYPFHQSYLTYLKKRFSRIFLPYLFWSAVYYFFVYTHHTISFFQSLLNGDASYQLYFIPALLIFYILFPLIHRYYYIFANRWMLIGLGFVELVLLTGDYYYQLFPLYYPLKVALLNYYIFLLGMVVARHHNYLFELVKKWKFHLIILLGLLATSIFIEGKILYMQTKNYLYFYSQWRPSVLLYSLLIFILTYLLFNKQTKYDKLIRSLSRLSFFVFFIHVIVLELVWNFMGKNLFLQTQHSLGQSLWYDPLFFIAIAVISYAIAYVAHRIPYLAKISG